MSQAVALLQTILGPQTSVALARATLDQALAAEVDPLHWCAIHLDQSAAQIMARAADWAGLSFLDTVPGHGEACLETGRMEALGQVRLFRTRLHDREVAFAAPDFLGVLRLARLRQERPHLCRTIFLVPEPALRTFLVDHAGPALIDSARQNMALVEQGMAMFGLKTAEHGGAHGGGMPPKEGEVEALRAEIDRLKAELAAAKK